MEELRAGDRASVATSPELIGTRMFGVALVKVGKLQSPDVAVRDAWAQRPTLRKKLLRDQHKVVTL